jgi:hypothetical protein
MFTRRVHHFVARFFQYIVLVCMLSISLWPGSIAGVVHPALAAAGPILYVKPGGPGDCSSWANACSLYTALATASSGNEIWATGGVYKSGTAGNRNGTIQLISGVAMYGGFNGTETLRDQRNLMANVSILSGDIDNNDSQQPIITDLVSVTGNTTNSYHVVTGAVGAILDGFTITAGYASNGTLPYIWGGGMYNNKSNPLLMNVNIVGNFADWGGGMANTDNSNAKLTNVTFHGNRALYFYGRGGGMFNNLDSHPELKNVTFSFNLADLGGGMANYYNCNPALVNVTFRDNTAGWGGGMHNEDSRPTLSNVTLTDNSANKGGGIYNHNSYPVIDNSILWGNTVTETGHQIYNDNSGTFNDNLYYSIVQAGCPAGSTCTHVINDYPLLGTLGFYGGFTQTIPLNPGSAAIDAGDDATCASTDQRGVIRPQGPHCDIGAYEFQLINFHKLYLPLVIR